MSRYLYSWKCICLVYLSLTWLEYWRWPASVCFVVFCLWLSSFFYLNLSVFLFRFVFSSYVISFLYFQHVPSSQSIFVYFIFSSSISEFPFLLQFFPSSEHHFLPNFTSSSIHQFSIFVCLSVTAYLTSLPSGVPILPIITCLLIYQGAYQISTCIYLWVNMYPSHFMPGSTHVINSSFLHTSLSLIN